MKIHKGEAGYIKKKKTMQTLVVVLFVAAGLSLFFICRQILGTTKNLGTVVAVLLTLPGAKALVNLVLFLPYQSVTPEFKGKCDSHLSESDQAYYDLVFTSPERVMHLDFLCVRGTELVGYSKDGKKEDKIESYFTETLKKQGVNVHMHVFRKEEELFNRLNTCQNGDAIPAEVTDFIHTILVK